MMWALLATGNYSAILPQSILRLSRQRARPVCAAGGRQRESNRARLLRPDSWEADEQSGLDRLGEDKVVSIASEKMM
jgi:hypothetical protein